MKKIAVLLTVHNRKEKTINCLRELFKQELPYGHSLDVYLTDDGCTDGTPEAIGREFPQIHIIRGNGNLFWNRGMYTAWSEAEKVDDYDFYLWLNDDTILLQSAILNLIEEAKKCPKAIIVGSIKSFTSDNVTYGGIKEHKTIQPNGNAQICDTFNGNCVLIPSSVHRTIGNLDFRYRHALGDIDYGLSATKKHIPIFCTGNFVGACDKNEKKPIWCRPEEPFLKRIKNLYSPLAYAEPFPFFHFNKKHYGLYAATKYFISQHIRVIIPSLWMK